MFCAGAICDACAPGSAGEAPVPGVASVDRGCPLMRLAISRLDTPITTANRLHHSRNSSGLRPSNALGLLMAWASVVLVLTSPIIMSSTYQVAVHLDVLYDASTCTSVYPIVSMHVRYEKTAVQGCWCRNSETFFKLPKFHFFCRVIQQ